MHYLFIKFMTLSNVTYVHYQDVLGTNAKNQVSGISLYFIYAHYMDVPENSGIPYHPF